MNQRKLTKREFIKLLGMGSLGLLFWQCYDSKSENSVAEETQSENSENSEKDFIPSLEFTDQDVIFLTRNDENFNQLRLGFNKRFDRFPKIIGLCFTTLGVQAAVQKARTEQLKVSVKSGGHSFESFSCGENSLLVNLSKMNKIEWKDAENVILQPACLLQEIYANFLPKKRIIPAGSCGTVGVAGLALGGGYGFFSRKYGLTCDNLTRIKLVNGKGELLDSNENPDLLWACRGGGNGNFGVVTELEFKTHPAPNSFSSYRLKYKNLNEERFMNLIRTWFEFTSDLRNEAFSAFVLNGKTLTILITNYQKHSLEFESSFEVLKSMADDYSPTYNQPLANALKRYYGRKDPLYFKNASSGLYHGIQDIEEILPEVFQKVISKSGMIYQINTLGGEIQNLEFEKNSSYPHRKFNYLSELQSYWENASQEKGFLDKFEEIQKVFHEQGISAQYRNYPDINFPNWETAYYGENYLKLQKLKADWDPEDLFSFEQSVRKA
jgi:hypothetical protein